jgi:predicted transcriptional regulator
MSAPTESAKQHLITVLEQQPDDSSYDELIKELAFVRMIDRGLNDAQAGRVVGNDDIRREIASWRNQK